jgi:hypothetical protein
MDERAIAYARLDEVNNELKEIKQEQSQDSRVRLSYTVLGGTGPSKINIRLEPQNQFSLSRIKKVVYLFDKDFEPSEIAVNNHEDEFHIKVESEKDFPVVAVILFDNGEKLKLSQYIETYVF